MTQISRLKVFQDGTKALPTDVNAEFDNLLNAYNANDTTLTNLINTLQSILDGNSGADYVKATSIEGLSGSTVQSLLESLKILADTLQQQITNNANTIALKANIADVYSKLESFSEAELQSSSGAANIGTSAISGVAGTNVQDMLASLKSLINQSALGQIPDGSITEQKLSFDPATQAEFNEHQADTVKHITADERTAWNAKADATALTNAKNDLEILYWMGAV